MRYILHGSSILMNRWLAGTGRLRCAAFCLLAALIGAATAPAGAQTPSPQRPGEAIIQGTVQDSTGKPVDDATVHLEKQGEGATDATTDAAGVLRFARSLSAHIRSARRNRILQRVKTLVDLIAFRTETRGLGPRKRSNYARRLEPSQSALDCRYGVCRQTGLRRGGGHRLDRGGRPWIGHKFACE